MKLLIRDRNNTAVVHGHAAGPLIPPALCHPQATEERSMKRHFSKLDTVKNGSFRLDEFKAR